MAMQTTTDTPVTPRNSGDYTAAHHTPVTPAEDIRTIMLNRVSWGAVAAGVVMALSVHLVLNLLGIALGGDATVTDTATVEETTVSTLSMGALIWWTVAGIISAFAGGFTAGRLAGEPKETTAGWHGLTSWGATVLVVAVLMTTAAGTLVGGNFTVMADITRERATVTATAPAAVDPYTTAPAFPGTAETSAPAATNVAVADDGNVIAGAALFSAIALLLGALAAWFGGCAGAVAPTLTDRTLRREQPLH